MLCNNPHAQVLLPAGPAPAADSTAAAHRGGCQFAGIRLLHLLHLLLCATYQPCSLLHAPGGPRRSAASAEWPIAWLPPACSGGERAAGITTDSHSHPRLQLQRRCCTDGARRSVMRPWLEDACTDKGSKH